MSSFKQQSTCFAVTLVLFSCPGVFSGTATRFDCENGNKGNITEITLKSALLCGTGYNPLHRPVKNQQDRVAMYIGADVMNVELLHNSYVKLEITVELSMQWYDAYLHWNKKEHGSVNTLTVSEQDIWTPKISAKSLLKSRVQDVSHCFQVKCHLSSDGEVIYSMMCTYEIECMDNSRHWAFETKNCPLRIFTPDYNINQLSLFHFQRRLSYSVSGVLPYKITSFQMAIVNNSVTPEFRMDIVVERMIGPHLVIFLVLILLLIALNLMITWFRVDTTVRAVMTSVSLGLHVIYTLILYWYSKTKMDPATGLANVLLGSLLLTVPLVGIFAYSLKMSKYDSTRIPHLLLVIHRAVSQSSTMRPFLQLGYINLDNPLIKATTEYSEPEMSNHVDQPEAMASDTTAIEHVDSDEEADPTKLKWSVFVQPFDRLIFCGMATTYVLMLLVLFLV